MDRWLKVAKVSALIGLVLLALMLIYNVAMVALGQPAPFTPWDELEQLAELVLRYLGGRVQ